jgi:D-alanyl-D-alanine carboxypeptidase (penicillin-binding protein 5/6)
MLVLAVGPSAAHAAGDFDPRKFATIVLDASSGEVLFAQDQDAERYPASLTKVMTLYLTFDAIERGDLRLTDTVTMSPRAASRPPSKLGLPAGRSLTVQEAIDVLVVKSANDVATALAERLAGTEARFAAKMTARARDLGMTHTHFTNASGLPDSDHVSTARDLAILARAFLRDHPQDYRVFDQQQTRFRGRVIPGHNALLARPGIDGFKTGFTNASGFNLLTSGARDGHRVIAVVLGGRTAGARDQFMRRLMRASFAALTIRDAGTDLSVASLLAPRASDALAPRAGLTVAGLDAGGAPALEPVADGVVREPGVRLVQ